MFVCVHTCVCMNVCYEYFNVMLFNFVLLQSPLEKRFRSEWVPTAKIKIIKIMVNMYFQHKVDALDIMH